MMKMLSETISTYDQYTEIEGNVSKDIQTNVSYSVAMNEGMASMMGLLDKENIELTVCNKGYVLDFDNYINEIWSKDKGRKTEYTEQSEDNLDEDEE